MEQLKSLRLGQPYLETSSNLRKHKEKLAQVSQISMGILIPAFNLGSSETANIYYLRKHKEKFRYKRATHRAIYGHGDFEKL